MRAPVERFYVEEPLERGSVPSARRSEEAHDHLRRSLCSPRGHARLGEVVLAWIKLKAGVTSTEEELREFCRGKIAHFKVPHYIRFVDSFPMTVTGKVQKFKIREQEIEMRGLEQAARIETA